MVDGGLVEIFPRVEVLDFSYYRLYNDGHGDVKHRRDWLFNIGKPF